ncbi:sensor histidine kinase [Conexibacter sp. SYSU D00693]|uniref:sensor histidine kinase n=1 Tax=Conexibacter sp. SYSU D00693 TaxID=2812560 RepID=UPI00196B5675|nr:ATP-binding protein [Conexibacter sp. SYSU D00693]
MQRAPSTTAAVLRFLAGSLAAIAVVVVGSSFVLREVATDEAERDTRQQVQLEGRLVESAGLTDGVLRGDARALRRLDDVVVGQVLVGPVVRAKLWTRDGRVLYSDEPRLVGRRFELGDEEAELFKTGGADAELSDLSQPENRFERQEGELLEAHTVIRTPSGTPVLFETYQRFSSITDDRSRLLGAIAPPLLGGLAILLLFQVPLALGLARRVRRGHAEREALLRAAIDASDAERRRIAADLHDGAVQDLAGVAFGLAPLADDARRRGDEDAARVLDQAAGDLRGGVRALRTLLVEIHPPSLASTGVEPALDDLLSPLAAAGVATELHVDDAAVAPGAHDALVYRVAREALRNVERHAQATSVRVDVTRDGRGTTRLVVHDDGQGFDAGQRARRGEEGHVGLTLLDGLVGQAGGTLDVASQPGAGTTITLEVGGA